jgi:hypothetical protein
VFIVRGPGTSYASEVQLPQFELHSLLRIFAIDHIAESCLVDTLGATLGGSGLRCRDQIGLMAYHTVGRLLALPASEQEELVDTDVLPLLLSLGQRTLGPSEIIQRVCLLGCAETPLRVLVGFYVSYCLSYPMPGGDASLALLISITARQDL